MSMNDPMKFWPIGVTVVLIAIGYGALKADNKSLATKVESKAETMAVQSLKERVIRDEEDVRELNTSVQSIKDEQVSQGKTLAKIAAKLGVDDE